MEAQRNIQQRQKEYKQRTDDQNKHQMTFHIVTQFLCIEIMPKTHLATNWMTNGMDLTIEKNQSDQQLIIYMMDFRNSNTQFIQPE